MDDTCTRSRRRRISITCPKHIESLFFFLSEQTTPPPPFLANNVRVCVIVAHPPADRSGGSHEKSVCPLPPDHTNIYPFGEYMRPLRFLGIVHQTTTLHEKTIPASFVTAEGDDEQRRTMTMKGNN